MSLNIRNRPKFDCLSADSATAHASWATYYLNDHLWMAARNQHWIADEAARAANDHAILAWGADTGGHGSLAYSSVVDCVAQVLA